MRDGGVKEQDEQSKMRNRRRRDTVPKSSRFPIFLSCHLSTFDVSNNSIHVPGFFFTIFL